MPSLFLFYNHNPERKDKAVEERRGHRAKSYADDATAIGLRPSPSGGTLRRSNDDGHKEEQDLSPNNVVASAPSASPSSRSSGSSIELKQDVIVRFLEVMDNYGSGRPSVMKTTRLLLDEDGWRGFYRGFGPRFLNMSLWGTSMIVTYELIKRLSVKSE